MTLALADTSFCFALYVKDKHTGAANDYMQRQGPVGISALIGYEFMQAVRLKLFFHEHNHAIGSPRKAGTAVLENFSSDIAGRILLQVPVDFKKVLETANDLSARYTPEQGYRSFDILHVATALVLKAETFLTFDAAQAALAKTEGLETEM